MSDKEKPEPITIQNPRYVGATPEMVAIALSLFGKKPKPSPREKSKGEDDTESKDE